jgi:EpsI family protein
VGSITAIPRFGDAATRLRALANSKRSRENSLVSSSTSIENLDRSEPATGATGRFPSPLGALTLAILALGFFAYRGLLDLARASTGVEMNVTGAERFFFVPSETSPAITYPVFFWMLWNRRRRLRAALPSPGSMLPAAAMLLTSVALALWAYHLDALTILIPSLSLFLVGAAWLLGGRRAASIVVVPALFLFVAYPLPGVLVNALVYPLQLAAGWAAGAFLTLLGMGYERSGDLIHAHGRVFQVIETCSGLRSIETLVMAAFVYCELFARSGRRLLLLVLAAPLVAFVINGLRVLTIILNPYSEIALVHTIQGLLAIVLGVFGIAVLDPALDRIPRERLRGAAQLRVPKLPSGARLVRPERWALLALLLVGLGAAAGSIPRWRPPVVSRDPLFSRVPPTFGEWTGQEATIDQTFLGTTRFSDRVYRTYRSGERAVTVFVAEDNRFHPLLSLVSPKTAVLESGFAVDRTFRVTVPALGGREVDALVLHGSKGEHELAFHWRDGAEALPVELVRSVLALDRSPLRRERPVRAVRVATPIPNSELGETQAIQRLQAFLDQLVTAVPSLAQAD